MPGYLRNFPDTQAFGKFPRYPGIWENFPDTQAFGKFSIYPGIWEISQIPRHLGNFLDMQAFVKFPIYACIWENFPNSYRYLRVVYFKDFGNFSNDWICLPKYSPNIWVFGKFLKCLGIWGITQMPGYLGNF